MPANATFPLGTAALASAKGDPVRVTGAIQKPEKIGGEAPEYPDTANAVSAGGPLPPPFSGVPTRDALRR